jgi:hypothetical protein
MGDRAQLDVRLARDPYEVAALVERLLDASAARDFASAQKDAAILERISHAPRAYSVLAKAANGLASVYERKGTFFIAPPANVPLEELAHTLRAALDALGELVASAPPTVFAEFHDGFGLENLTSRDSASLSRFRFSTQLFNRADWRAIVWHEVGHAILGANCRFLDEGWAVWCQLHSTERFDFPVPSTQIVAWSVPRSIDEIPVSAFLRNSGRDLTFCDIADDENERMGVYVRGQRFISSIVERYGMAALAQVFRATLESGDALACIKDAFGETPEVLDPLSPEPTLAGIDRGFRQVRMHKKRFAAEPFLEMTQRFCSREASPEALLLLAKLLINKITTAVELRAAPADMEAITAEFDNAIERVEQIASGDKTCAMLKIMRNMAAAPQLAGAEFAALMINTENDMRKALQAAPNNTEILLCLARMELSKPSQYADRAGALHFLARAAEDTEATREAVAVAQSIR